MLGTVAAFAAALFSLGLFFTVAVVLWRRGHRGAEVAAAVFGLLPLPIHLLVGVVLSAVLGVHFFTR